MDRHKLQFSLRSLLGFAIVVAVGCAALVRPSFMWASAIWTATMGLLAVAVIGAVCGRGPFQAFCRGAVVLGGGYMILALGPWFDDTTGEFLLTRQLLDWVSVLLGHEVSTLSEMPGIWHDLPWSYDNGSSSYVYLDYLVAGNSLITIGLAYLGGLLGRWFHETCRCAQCEEN